MHRKEHGDEAPLVEAQVRMLMMVLLGAAPGACCCSDRSLLVAQEGGAPGRGGQERPAPGGLQAFLSGKAKDGEVYDDL